MTTGDIDPTRLRIGALEAKVAELESSLGSLIATEMAQAQDVIRLVNQVDDLTAQVSTLARHVQGLVRS